VPTGPEICGDCIDNDCNGLTDFEDPACCAPQSPMTVSKASIRPRGKHGTKSRLLVRSSLGASCEEVFQGPITQERDLVEVQLRETDQELLCARIPADKFMKMGKMKTSFWDLGLSCTCADTIRDTAFTCHHGTERFYTASDQATFAVPSTNTVRITVGLRDKLSQSKNFCSTVEQPFRTKKNALVFP
jgi:hypothetical protein